MANFLAPNFIPPPVLAARLSSNLRCCAALRSSRFRFISSALLSPDAIEKNEINEARIQWTRTRHSKMLRRKFELQTRLALPCVVLPVPQSSHASSAPAAAGLSSLRLPQPPGSSSQPEEAVVVFLCDCCAVDEMLDDWLEGVCDRDRLEACACDFWMQRPNKNATENILLSTFDSTEKCN